MKDLTVVFLIKIYRSQGTIKVFLIISTWQKTGEGGGDVVVVVVVAGGEVIGAEKVFIVFALFRLSVL